MSRTADDDTSMSRYIVEICSVKWCEYYQSLITDDHKHSPKDGKYPTGICERCARENMRSRVYPGAGSFITIMSVQTYYDEDGVLHIHNPNKSTALWFCSSGHKWVITTVFGCPAGDITRSEEITFK